jgi:hypothetical protein
MHRRAPALGKEAMSRERPSFPPDVAHALPRPAGSASVRYTVPTGSRAEGARVALVNVAPLLAAGRHWDIALAWDAGALHVTVRDQHAPGGPVLTGRWPRA